MRFGTNGFEDYLAAADFYPGSDASTLATLFGKTSPPPAEALRTERLIVSRNRKVIQLVLAGNKKPVSDPRKNPWIATLFPELAGFKALPRLFVAKADVEFADRNGSEATNSLMAAMTLGSKMPRTNLIHGLVGMRLNRSALPASSGTRMRSLAWLVPVWRTMPQQH